MGFDRGASSTAASRVLDVGAFNRMRAADPEIGSRRVASALGATKATAQRLMAGKHWQQDPAKVRLFNEHKGANLDPETGVPTAEDLQKFGGPYARLTRYSTPAERDIAELLRATGAPAGSILEAVRRLEALQGREAELPAKVDAKYLTDEVNRKFARALLFLDDVAMATATPEGLARIARTLFDIRQLLLGEPTQIVSYEQRVRLDSLVPKLVEEAKRRGITLEGEFKEVGNA